MAEIAVNEASQQLAHYSQILNACDEKLVAVTDEITSAGSDVEQTVAAIEEKWQNLQTARGRLLTLPSELEDIQCCLQSKEKFLTSTQHKIVQLRADIQHMSTAREKVKSGILVGPTELSERLKALAQQRKTLILNERVTLRADITSAKHQFQSNQHESSVRKGAIHEQRQSQLLGEAQLLQLQTEQKSDIQRLKELELRHEALRTRITEIEDRLPAIMAERSTMDDRFRGLDAQNRQLLGRLQQLNLRSPVTQRAEGIEWAPREQPAFRSAFALLAHSSPSRQYV